MAIYGNQQYLYTPTGRADEFADLHGPGSKAPFSGIYKCVVCGFEIVSEEDKELPSHRHNQEQGAVRWVLLVRVFNGYILGP